MNNENFVNINGRNFPINGEKNLLELIRRAGIDLPTFCYHSDLSVYGACRLCIVDIEGKGIVTSCTTQPQSGMVVKTNTNELRDMRKIYLELMLANHHQGCATCGKNYSCKLQSLANKMGITNVRFKNTADTKLLDDSNPSLIRDPNKCILCGDCVRACSEIQGIGAIDFSNRGASTTVVPAFGKKLEEVDCVYCGLCASVCPTGAIIPKSEIEVVWKAINDPTKIVIAQIAPAIRVAIGEMFGMDAGVVTTGKIAAALKMLGFDKVYDTSFAADLTILEEANEFFNRKEQGQNLPLFTSCCPAWVKFAEQYYSELLPNLSTCRSPQQMLGSVAKATLPKELGIDKKDIFVVSLMPCTAKKFEAKRPEFTKDGICDVDAVLTTAELGKLIKEAGLQFNDLTPESLDMPLGFKTGAGVIFGNTGGVSEAVLRYASEKLTGVKLNNNDFVEIRGTEGIRVRSVTFGETQLKLAIVHGLKNARQVIEQIKAGQLELDFVEVMSCPGGCIAGAGQPVSFDVNVKTKRTNGLYETDKTLQLHKSQDNPYVTKCYNETLGKIGSHRAHDLLHTKYGSRKRFSDNAFSIMHETSGNRVEVSVCVGTSCYLRGSQKLMQKLLEYVDGKGIADSVDIKATFCFEKCDKGPRIKINGKVMHKCTVESAVLALQEELEKQTI